MSVVEEIYTYAFKEVADPRVYNWPFMKDPRWLIGVITIYLFSIYKFLPEYMARKKPCNIKMFLAIYNVYQIVACPLLIYGVTTSGWTTHYTLGCQDVDYSNGAMAVSMARWMWWHLILKASELIETVFFVLRKKYSQVTVLHVYHHITTLITAWLACKYAPGGMATFTVLVNSFVHTLMYSYYLLSSFGPKWQQLLTMVKSKLTTIQIIQLVLIFLHSVQGLLPHCRVNSAVTNIYYYYVLTVAVNIILFLHFYVRNYTKKIV